MINTIASMLSILCVCLSLFTLLILSLCVCYGQIDSSKTIHIVQKSKQCEQDNRRNYIYIILKIEPYPFALLTKIPLIPYIGCESTAHKIFLVYLCVINTRIESDGRKTIRQNVVNSQSDCFANIVRHYQQFCRHQIKKIEPNQRKTFYIQTNTMSCDNAIDKHFINSMSIEIVPHSHPPKRAIAAA